MLLIALFNKEISLVLLHDTSSGVSKDLLHDLHNNMPGNRTLPPFHIIVRLIITIIIVVLMRVDHMIMMGVDHDKKNIINIIFIYLKKTFDIV